MSKTILIVDDEIEISEIIAFRMEEEGFSTFSARNGKEALKIIEDQNIDVIVSDVRMPLMDGITLLISLQEKLKNPPPMILLSGFTDVTEEEAKNFGAFKFLSKPMEMNDLVTAVKEALKGS